jgi:hypothetical protein
MIVQIQASWHPYLWDIAPSPGQDTLVTEAIGTQHGSIATADMRFLVVVVGLASLGNVLTMKMKCVSINSNKACSTRTAFGNTDCAIQHHLGSDI